jgi:hypothetical protein
LLLTGFRIDAIEAELCIEHIEPAETIKGNAGVGMFRK